MTPMCYEPDDNLDEVACDQCGKPTPRLKPAVPRELCDACFDELTRRLERRVAAFGQALREAEHKESA